jgi:hypothetical protein
MTYTHFTVILLCIIGGGSIDRQDVCCIKVEMLLKKRLFVSSTNLAHVKSRETNELIFYFISLFVSILLIPS